ncbi:MAG TPA: O-methyltransferase [Solirubrobacterales bacterium]|nr:O-methyltransferase [Solirubrobacterales bacterium]
MDSSWAAVDEYVGGLLSPHDEGLSDALEAAEKAGLPEIQVSPPQGKLLQLLAGATGSRRILEFGTLGGYSTIWLGRALAEDGHLLSLEASTEYAEVARSSIERAGLGDRIEIRTGPALETLAELGEEGVEPFDFVFIDADKVNTPNYFSWCLDHVTPGALVVADNVVRGGTLAAEHSNDASAEAQRRFHEMAAADPRVEATTIQTVGSKGHDGFTLALIGA